MQTYVPSLSKMESFIRSKYESRRWALDGPPPSDPSVLDNGAASQPAAAPIAQAPPQAAPAPVATSSRPTHNSTNSLSSRAAAAPLTTRQPVAHQLLSSNFTNRSTPAAPAPAPAVQEPAQPAAPANDLFSLDFHAPSPATSPPAPEPKKDVKQDILSLFSAPPPQFQNQAAMWGGAAPAQQPIQQHQQQQAMPPQMTSMMGNNGPGMWGASSGWTGAQAMPAQPNVWGAPAAPAALPQQQAALFNTNAVWGAPNPAPGAAAGGSADLFGSFASAQPAAAPKKDDVFGDIWGGFK